ncbi:MAG TPA: DUF1697 domain-containing protein [Steroidobacteraceae bacterium]|nr:DUF1697 domain-containing protein [Steroidobacteraceae bacterium]
MSRYVALVRGVNVIGANKLPMATLRSLCGDCGFQQVATYIASGNVVLESRCGPARVKSELEARLLAYLGRPIAVFVRTGAEMRAVLEANPFRKTEPSHTFAFFLENAPPEDSISRARRRTDEEIRLGRRELYVYYPSGMGQSRLEIPAAKVATARNMNTVAQLVAMST